MNPNFEIIRIIKKQFFNQLNQLNHLINQFDQLNQLKGNSMEELMKELIKFQGERDWKRYHTPENLAKSISIEAAELLEHFQWQKEYDKDEVVDELADVLNYCFLMADALDVDVKEIVLNKMKKNAIKYPPKTDLKD